MTKRTIEVNAPKVDRTISVEFDFGDNLNEMVAKFGEMITFEHALDNMVIAAQAYLRNRLERTDDKYKSNETIAADFATWAPSTRKQADPAKVAEQFKKLASRFSREELLAMLGEGEQPAKKPVAPALVKGDKKRKAA